MDKNKIIEIKKLWFVANKYYDLAIDEKNCLPKKDLDLTVKELICKCPDSLGLNFYQHLIYFSAHLASCSIRLCSIEENLRSKRLDRYNEIVGWKDIDKIQNKIKNSMNIYIHFFLRNMVAHSESARLDVKKKNAKIVYNEMYKIYLCLDYKTILCNLEFVKNEIEKEINLTF
jgi:hypothetical protein